MCVWCGDVYVYVYALQYVYVQSLCRRMCFIGYQTQCVCVYVCAYDEVTVYVCVYAITGAVYVYGPHSVYMYGSQSVLVYGPRSVYGYVYVYDSRRGREPI